MSIGTGVGIAIAGAAAAGATAYAAHKAGEAAQGQQQAANQSLDLQKQIYNETTQRLSPYADLGVGALGNLRQLAGVPNPMTGSGKPTATAPPGSPSALAPNAYSYNPQTGVSTYNGYNPQTGQITGTPPVSYDPRTGQTTVNPTASGYVTMRAPDGSTQQVDPGHVDYYRQKGAQVVS